MKKQKQKKLIIFLVTAGVMIMLISDFILPMAGDYGSSLGKKYNLVNYAAGELADSYISVPRAKAGEDTRTPTEKFYDSFDEDQSFRDYILGMEVARNNPGNLRFANQPHAWNDRGFAHFPNTIIGFRALIKQLECDIARDETLEKFVEDYAPRQENNTDKYLNDLEKEVGNRHNKLSDLDILWLAVSIVKQEHSVAY